MNRKQAVTVIKDIFDTCYSMEGKSLKLLPPKADNTLSKTCQIHIQANDDPFLKSCVERIASEYNLAVKQEDGFLIIYKPYPSKR